MKALVKTKEGFGNLAYCDVPEPEPGPGEVKIKIAFAGICGSDVKFYSWTHRESLRVPIPMILGHEFSGTVVAVGAGVTRAKVGDRVTAEPAKYICGKCDHCINGDPLYCTDKKSVGVQMDGAFAEYLCTREEIVHVLPEGVSLEAASLTEPAAVAMRCVYDQGNIRPGDTALIFGPGAIGLLCVQFAKANGARVILVGTERDQSRMEIGRALGAEILLYADKDDVPAAVLQHTGGLGADCVIECSGSIAALNSGALCAKKKGDILAVGLFKNGPLEITALNTIVGNDLTLHGSYGSKHQNWLRALRMMERGQLNTEALITHKFHLSEGEKGFQCAEKLEGIKILFYP